MNKRKCALIAGAVLLCSGGSYSQPNGEFDVEPRCSYARIIRWGRPDSAAWIRVSGTADSILVGKFKFGRGGVTMDTLDAQPNAYQDRSGRTSIPIRTTSRSQNVFAQIARVRDADLRLKEQYPPRSEVVLIWWQYGMACERQFPEKANSLGAGEEALVFLRARPRTEWVGGRPTFDAASENLGEFGVYFPRTPYPGEPQQMSVSEYLKFYAILPTESEVQADRAKTIKRFRDWVKKNKAVSKKAPAINYFGLIELDR